MNGTDVAEVTSDQVTAGRVTLADVKAARARLRDAIEPTPLAHSGFLSQRWGGRIFFKLENLQTTGSFKERGALNKLLLLSPEESGRGVITASAGNHGQAVAYHARRLGIPATVVMPVNTPLIKSGNTASFGAQVVLFGGNFDEAADHAHQLQSEQGLTYVHGFDDAAVIAGQGTVGFEILEQCVETDVVVVPVGGGGLIAGVALAVKALKPGVRVIGVQTEVVPGMKLALEKGERFTLPACRSLADGIAVRRVGQLPYEMTRNLVDEIVTVSEDEIANAILLLLEREKAVVEGAGAVGVAAMENGYIRAQGQTMAIILSGGNIDVNVLSRIIDKGLVKGGRLARLRVIVPDHPGQLARVLEIVAAAKANILEISHSRAFNDAAIGETVIDLVLETRGHDHIDEIHAKLVATGVRAEKQS